MNKATRKAVIAGNWKMNKTPAEAVELINAIKAEIEGKDVSGCEIVTCVPYAVKAPAIAATLKNTLTNEVPATMLKQHPAFTLYIDADSASELNLPVVW